MIFPWDFLVTYRGGFWSNMRSKFLLSNQCSRFHFRYDGWRDSTRGPSEAARSSLHPLPWPFSNKTVRPVGHLQWSGLVPGPQDLLPHRQPVICCPCLQLRCAHWKDWYTCFWIWWQVVLLLCLQQDLGLWDAVIYLTGLISSSYYLSGGWLWYFSDLVTYQVYLMKKLLTVFQLTFIWRDGSYSDLFKEFQGRSHLHCRMRKLLGWYLFLSAIYWNYFDCTSSINTSGERAYMYFTERYSEHQAVFVVEVSQSNLWN